MNGLQFQLIEFGAGKAPVHSSVLVRVDQMIDGNTFTFGRASGSHIKVSQGSKSVSNNHGTFTIENGKIYYEDHSTNGSTIINWHGEKGISEYFRDINKEFKLDSWLVISDMSDFGGGVTLTLTRKF